MGCNNICVSGKIFKSMKYLEIVFAAPASGCIFAALLDAIFCNRTYTSAFRVNMKLCIPLKSMLLHFKLSELGKIVEFLHAMADNAEVYNTENVN